MLWMISVPGGNAPPSQQKGASPDWRKGRKGDSDWDEDTASATFCLKTKFFCLRLV